MDIQFTKKQYETLLKLTTFGTWMAGSSETEMSNEEYDKFHQYILSFAGAFKVNGIADKEAGGFEMNEDYENELQKIINAYEDLVFWDKLAYYLAARELQEEARDANYSEEEYFTRLVEVEDKYHNLLEKTGLEKIKVEPE
ncbi:hypothetical protein D0469_17240 [Peribacillus saganii]|uniref:Uncharacterized protein n=1 Tax=Peribacillus saganii TaxID=2303992 RepID=A0A372LKZ9_9BACI|nr:hypothetical protein [Peribacillus saganii]RFU66378.1 hypothetical protein D0469_17240 [Peribacillus saganii]